MTEKTVETTIWNDGWIQVKIPLPFSLKWVNSYLLPEENGCYTLIDPGLRTEEAISAWDEALRKHGIGMKQIIRIILTHQHPDHYGLAGYFQELTGAPVYLSSRSHQYALRSWGEDSHLDDEIADLFTLHGMPSALALAVKENFSGFVNHVTPHPTVSYIEAGGKMKFGGLEWQLIDAPGHATGQLSFYEPINGWMLCGDQVLPRITPNVSIVPGEEADPLHSFLMSLENLRQYDVRMAFPGHRDPFAEFARRIDELQQHHARRLDQMCQILVEPLSAFALCEMTFGKRLRDNPHNLRFGMAEILAHLFYLERRGRVIRTGTSEVYFQAT
ncbi:MAG: MBL fold metallo-hydrolase [Candidatus Pristimantibacillus sp.]